MNGQSQPSPGRGTIGIKQLKSAVNDNSRTIIEQFWERSIPEQTSKVLSVNITDKIISLVGKASESIFISSPKIILADLQVVLGNAKEKRDVRIYGLTTNLKGHKDVFDFGMMRELKEVQSTLLLIDPQGKKPKGMWFSGELSPNLKEQTVFITLSPNQVKDAYSHYCHRFWKAQGNELIFGKMRSILPLKPELGDIPPILQSSIRCEQWDEVLEGKHIQEMWFGGTFPMDVLPYHPEAGTIVLQLNNAMKDHIYWTQLDNKNIRGCTNLSISRIQSKEDDLVYHGDLGFFLTEEQQRILENLQPEPDWSYRSNTPIDEIKGDIIQWDEDWEEGDASRIEDHTTVPLQNVYADSIEDWMNETPEPDYPSGLHLARKVQYSWNLHPPYLPQGAKKHALYKSWDTFTSNFQRQATITKSLIQKFSSDSEKSFFAKARKVKSQIPSWVSFLDAIHEKEWYTEGKESITQTIKELYDIQEQVADIAKQSLSGKKSTEDLNELETISKLPKKRRALIQNELQEIQKPKRGEMDLRSLIPRLPLPGIGELYEAQSRNYLVISQISEIQETNKIRNTYHAKIAVHSQG